MYFIYMWRRTYRWCSTRLFNRKSSPKFLYKFNFKELQKNYHQWYCSRNIIFEGSTEIKDKTKPKKTKKYIRANVPSNSFGSPKDIFDVCKMISENKSKFITGSLFKLDGGQTKSL